MEDYKEEGICCICGGNYTHWGNNPSPVKETGRCCDTCNTLEVIPARIKKLEQN